MDSRNRKVPFSLELRFFPGSNGAWKLTTTAKVKSPESHAVSGGDGDGDETILIPLGKAFRKALHLKEDFHLTESAKQMESLFRRFLEGFAEGFTQS